VAGTTYSKFFWQDWAGDDLLALCSMPARGTWIGLLAVAARSGAPGHVLLDGKKPTLTDLRQVLRCPEGFTDAELQVLIDELISRGVCSLTREGVIVSRRMVRDNQKRLAKSKGGKKSAEVRAGKIGENPISSNRGAEVPSTINHQPSTINHQKPGAGGKEDFGWVTKVSSALGRDLTAQDPGRAIRFMASWAPLREQGVDLDLDLIPVIEQAKAGGRVPGDLGSLKYFEKRAIEHKLARLALAGAKAAKAEILASPEARADWKRALDWFVADGFWDRDRRGANPCEENCQAPADLLADAAKLWGQQGHKPLKSYGDRPKPFWGGNVVPLRAAPTGG
jgi:hypothetical protein